MPFTQTTVHPIHKYLFFIKWNVLSFFSNQNTGEAPHEGQCRLWEALNLSTLLLVCAHGGPVPFWPGGSSCALPVDLPHCWSSRRVPGRSPGSHRLSGKLPHYTSDLLHHVFILQQKEKHRQHVNYQIHEAMYRPWEGRETSCRLHCNIYRRHVMSFYILVVTCYWFKWLSMYVFASWRRMVFKLTLRMTKRMTVWSSPHRVVSYTGAIKIIVFVKCFSLNQSKFSFLMIFKTNGQFWPETDDIMAHIT